MISFVTEAFFFMAAICSKVIRSFAETIFPPPRKNISGEIVFLTGAGSGLGRLMALKFAKLGATIACVDINQSANEGVVREIKSLGFNAHGFKCDCSSRQEIYRVAELVKKQVGDVTMLINNAGIVSGKKFLETEDWMIQKTMEVNTMAHFWVSLRPIANFRLCYVQTSNTPRTHTIGKPFRPAHLSPAVMFVYNVAVTKSTNKCDRRTQEPFVVVFGKPL